MIRGSLKLGMLLALSMVLGTSVAAKTLPRPTASTLAVQGSASVRFLRRLPEVETLPQQSASLQSTIQLTSTQLTSTQLTSTQQSKPPQFSTLRMLPPIGQDPIAELLFILPDKGHKPPAQPLHSHSLYYPQDGKHVISQAIAEVPADAKVPADRAAITDAPAMLSSRLIPSVAYFAPAEGIPEANKPEANKSENLPGSRKNTLDFVPVEPESNRKADPTISEELLSPSGLGDSSLTEVPHLSVVEAIRVGLENNKNVVVRSYVPLINSTNVDAERAPFDPIIGATAYGGQSDAQVRSEIQSLGALSDFLETDFLRPFRRPDNLYVKRKLYTGGEIKLGFSTDYQHFSPEGTDLIVNPGWDSALNFRFDQPLFQGRGPDVTTARIRIAAAKRTQSRFEFMSEVREATRDIEIAYWEFAGAQRSFKALSEVVVRSEKLLEQQVRRKELGSSAKPEVLLAKNLLEEFLVLKGEEKQRLEITESQLRQVMGIRANGDPCMGMSSFPFTAVENSKAADLDLPQEATVQMALQRPEMLARCAAIRAAKVNMSRAKNGLQPDISARVDYSVHGLEENLDESIGTIGRHKYKTWAVGLIYQRPLGLRAQKADLRRAKLTLIQETKRRDLVRHEILHSLRRADEVVESTKALLAIRQRRVTTAAAQMEAFDSLYNERESRVGLFMRLEVERTLALARAEHAIAWTNLQLALANRNYEANYVSPALHIEVESPIDTVGNGTKQ